MRADSLKKLELSGYFPMFSTHAMKHISELTILEKLNVRQNVSVTDDVLIAIGANCKQLRYLDIQGKSSLLNFMLIF